MIPKTIHYCWFGGNPLPPLALKCMESWEKYCPDYEIKKWDEKNFDINFNLYTKQAYELKKWAFVSDVARLYAVYVDGGIYLDTDVEIIKPLDSLLTNSMYLGFENSNCVNTGLGFGAEKNHIMVKNMLDFYNGMCFLLSGRKINSTPCPTYNTEIIRREGFMINNEKQTKNNVTLYPTEYLCPKDYQSGDLLITLNTYSIHHFNESWTPKYKMIWRYLSRKIWFFHVIDRMRKEFKHNDNGGTGAHH